MPMTLAELESEVKRLREEVAEAARTRDYLEIWKLQSLYAHLYHLGKRAEVSGLFARKTPGVTMEIEDSGVYEGIESITRFWNTVFAEKRHMVAGFLAIHMTVNPSSRSTGPGRRRKACGTLTGSPPWGWGEA